MWRHLAVRRERYSEEGFRLGLVAKCYQDAIEAVVVEDPVQIMKTWGDICARKWSESEQLSKYERAALIAGKPYLTKNITDIKIHQGRVSFLT